MSRSLDGAINAWNRVSAEQYGYPGSEALGRISHTLLKTEFPEPLKRINEQLREQFHWRGRLIHTTSAGRKVEVESRWGLVTFPHARTPEVIEINCAPGAGSPA